MNITVLDLILSLYQFITIRIKNFLRYKKTYQNYYEVIKKFSKNKFPISGILRNGNSIILKNKFITTLFTLEGNEIIKFEKNYAVIETASNIPRVKFIDFEDNGDLLSIFIKNEYRDFYVKDKTVIDIGANIGDSSIYFITKNAKKVIAIEPFEKNYLSLKENIGINNLTEKIIPIQAFCSGNETFVEISKNEKGGGSTNYVRKSEKDVVKISTISISNILEKYKMKENIVLKIDCEGCEYDLISNTPNEILNQIDEIFIEYHMGYLDIVKKLKECRFEIKLEKPLFYWVPHLSPRTRFVGYIHAKK